MRKNRRWHYLNIKNTQTRRQTIKQTASPLGFDLERIEQTKTGHPVLAQANDQEPSFPQQGHNAQSYSDEHQALFFSNMGFGKFYKAKGAASRRPRSLRRAAIQEADCVRLKVHKLDDQAIRFDSGLCLVHSG